jgi:accessory gene regulator protein AgrB
MGALVNDNSQAKGPINHKRVLPALLAFATMCASIVCGLVTLVIFVVNGTVYIELDGADNFEVVLAAIGTIYLVTLLFVPIYFFELFNQTKYDQKKHYYLASIFLVYAAIGIYFFIGVFNLVDNA